MEAKVGDRIAVESERVGKADREGEVLEVLSPGPAVHYRIRWTDGHESIFLPSAGSMKVIAGGRKRV
jgi:hypothetical protein